MVKKVAAYGLAQAQLALLEAAMPEGYQLIAAECLTDLIVTASVCSIVNAERMSQEEIRVLLCCCMDRSPLDETLVWLGDIPLPNGLPVIRCDGYLDLLTELDSILSQGQTRYGAMQMYGGEYAFLPRHAIEESLEADVYAALRRKYGNDPHRLAVRRLRREWQAVLEAGGAEELAAVYELTRWLKRRGCCFHVACQTVFPFVLFLLDITEEDPVRQKDRLKIGYEFHLSESMRPEIRRWSQNHWLKREAAQPLTLGNIRFQFCE